MQNVSHEQEKEVSICECKNGHYPVKNNDIITNRYKAVIQTGLNDFFAVWQCWDLQEQRFVSVKITQTLFTEIAEHEISLLKQTRYIGLENPRRERVIEILDDFEVRGKNCIHVCLVYEAMGYNLSEYSAMCPNKLIPLPMVKSIIKQVLEGLDYLHAECKIAHMDIKPENIFICKDEKALFKFAADIGFKPDVTGKSNLELLVKQLEEVRIHQLSVSAVMSSSTVSAPVFKLDLGISVKIANLGNAFCEEPCFDKHEPSVPYRSPEVILGAPYDTSADIWSVACMAFKLATGNCLFEPVESAFCSEDADHLSQMIDLLGKIPPTIALSGKFSSDYFNEDGDLLNIKMEPCDVYQVLMEKYKFSEIDAAIFSNFLDSMLAFNIAERSTAKDCIKDLWLED